MYTSMKPNGETELSGDSAEDFMDKADVMAEANSEEALDDTVI